MTRPLHDEYQPGHEGGARPRIPKETFSTCVAAANGWRCWDRTESNDRETRIIDGAVWGILESAKDGKIPGMIIAEKPTVAEDPPITAGPIMFLLGAFVTSLLWAGALLLRAAAVI